MTLLLVGVVEGKEGNSSFGRPKLRPRMARIRSEKASLRPKNKKARTGVETGSGFFARPLAGSTGSGGRMNEGLKTIARWGGFFSTHPCVNIRSFAYWRIRRTCDIRAHIGAARP
ncbi:hypothetical protein [Variovorax paradoxus]|uniref:hypothetical protein n=1 Tax=Variovorax paradoxus TaxID=34073 RepID=UPI0029C76EC3|nr:hypothetical protein [Variovorax paradoxus]WPH20700.1 hypothetical protein RZE78_00725 [Variovorax paradoxus]